MNEPMRQRPDGRWERVLPVTEPFGVIWERCLRHRRNHGVPYLIALVYSWRDARALQRLEREEGQGG